MPPLSTPSRVVRLSATVNLCFPEKPSQPWTILHDNGSKIALTLAMRDLLRRELDAEDAATVPESASA